jgi:hypothetical protein
MSDYTWDQVDVEETITETDQKQSESLDVQTPVGKLFCTVVECEPIEKNFNKYSCMAAKLKMRIDGLIQLEQPVLNVDGTPVKREGEIVKKVQNIPAEKMEEFKALLLGQYVFDEVNLYHPKEKDAMKRRRLFIAKRLGLIAPTAQTIGAQDWAGAPGKQVLVTTEWNSWKDKDTGELKRNVKVGWSGYDFASAYQENAPDIENDDFSGI